MNGETQGALAANPLAAQNQSLEFGDGTDGDLTVPFGQIVRTDSETSRVVGNNAAGSSEIQVEFPGGFNQGDEVLIITMQNREQFGQGSGQYETHRISQVVGRTLLLDSPLVHTYSTGQHQVIRVPQYRDVVIEGLLTCAAWNGFVGGVLFFRATGSVVVSESGSINASGMGYRWGRGGDNTTYLRTGYQGESIAGRLDVSKYRLIGAGGRGSHEFTTGQPLLCSSAGGGGPGYASLGSAGSFLNLGLPGEGGGTYGQPELMTLFMGSGGGGGTGYPTNCSPDHLVDVGGRGGSGGGIIAVFANSVAVIGSILSNGLSGSSGTRYGEGGGGGSGGSIFLTSRELNNSGIISARGGDPGRGGDLQPPGGASGHGRIRIDSGDGIGSGNGTIFPSPFYGVRPIVINEIMQNPKVVSDTDGEWIELLNVGPRPVNVNQWILKDEGTDMHVISNGGPLIIEPGGFLVLGRNSDSISNGGVSVDYQYDNFFLRNSSDEVILLAPDGTGMDRVAYDDGGAFPDPDGASIELIDPLTDNNDGRNWREAQTPFGAGDLGTPGAPNSVAQTPVHLVTEEEDSMKEKH